MMYDNNAHILITGGTGFFGTAFLRHFKSLGLEAPRITILSRDPKRFFSKHTDLANMAEWIKGDVIVPNSLPHDRKFSHILHCATDSTLGPKISPLDRYIQIVEGTRNILEYAVTTGSRRFLLTSSGGVYGPQSQKMKFIPEDYNGMPDPLEAIHSYSIAKRCAEHLCALYRDLHGIDTVVARCFTFAGRDLPINAHFAIGNFVRDALEHPEIYVAGDGTPIRSYMDQRDLANWLATLLSCGNSGQAYNIGSNVSISIEELAKKVRNIIAPDKPVKILHKTENNNFRNRYVPSINKVQKEHGLKLSYTLEDSIKSMATTNSDQDIYA
jgi:UDP-glucuronate decarboxylase